MTGRHLVYAGELDFVVNETRTILIPLWAVLCSDMLLLTTKDDHGKLTVVDDPLYLSDTVQHGFSRQKGKTEKKYIRTFYKILNAKKIIMSDKVAYTTI